MDRVTSSWRRDRRDQSRRRAGAGQRALRRDFYHRLNVLSITVPPLCDRGADLPTTSASSRTWPGAWSPRFAAAASNSADLPEELRVRVAAAPGRVDPTEAQLVSVVQTSRTMSEAAAQLGIDRSTLFRPLARYGLRRKNTPVAG